MKRPFALFLLTVALSASLAGAQTNVVQPAELTQAQLDGRALAYDLRVQRPDKDYTAEGKLRFRNGRGERGEVALHFATTVLSGTNWTTVYAVTGVTNGAQLTVLHRGLQPNEYTFSEAGKTSTLSGAAVMTPFAGTDFWLADLGLEFFQWPEQTLLKHELRRTRSCRVLESVNPKPVSGGYARVVSWVDRESGGIVHADAYDTTGAKLKEFEPKEFKKVNGEWQLQEMEISNVQANSRTTISFQLKD